LRRGGDDGDLTVLRPPAALPDDSPGGRSVVVKWCFPTPLRVVDQRPRVVSRVWWRTMNLVLCACSPPLLFIWRSTLGAHQPWIDWAPPIRARSRRKGPSRWAGPDIILTGNTHNGIVLVYGSERASYASVSAGQKKKRRAAPCSVLSAPLHSPPPATTTITPFFFFWACHRFLIVIP